MAKLKAGLSQRALLVSVNISQWAARKMDKRATETVNVAHRTSSLAGAYSKKLLPQALELETINTITSQTRKYYYEQTLPWVSDGTRIISAKNYLSFVTEMKRLKNLFEHAVKDFQGAYPRLQKEAAKVLGDLYDKDEYPDDIAARFDFMVTYFPLPDVKDFRVQISEAEKREFQRKMKEVESAAMRDCWERLYSVVNTAAEKLKQKDAIFRDSLIENIQSIVDLLPSLNIADDGKLEAQRKEIEKLIGKIDPDELRENPDERKKASKALSEIESKMGAIMGSKKK